MVGGYRFLPLWVVSGVCLLGCGSRVPPDLAPNLVAVSKIRSGLEVAAGGGATQGTAASQEQPTGFATLRGTFKLDGTAPSPVALNIDKQQEVCAPGGRTVYDPSLLVAEGGGIANVLIFAVDVPDAWVHETAKGNSEEAEFDQKECMFLTRVAAYQTTQRLKVLNSDPVGHNTNMEPRKNTPMNQTIPVRGYTYYPPTGSGELVEEKAPFPVTCNIHPWMRAWMIFRPNAYFAVTNPDGSFEIPNLPAGVDLQLQVWQEKLKFVGDSQVTVDSPVVKNWNRRGTVTVRLEPDQDGQLEVAVKSSAFQ